MTTVQAYQFKRFGEPEVLELGTLDLPVLEDNQVVVIVKAVAVNPLDCKIRKGRLKEINGTKFPMYTGTDFCGVVDEIGSEVSGFKAGDFVYGSVNYRTYGGAMAEKVMTAESNLARKPETISYMEAAGSVSPALEAFQAISACHNTGQGRRIFINGATNNTGMFAVQFAKMVGFHVTVSSSKNAVRALKSLGADDAFHYSERNLAEFSQTFDYLLDLIGSFTTFAAAKPMLKAEGKLITTAHLPGLSEDGNVIVIDIHNSGKQLQLFSRLFDLGEIKCASVRKFAFEDIAQAHALVESGEFIGNTIITLNS